jgi:hypothetical protein
VAAGSAGFADALFDALAPVLLAGLAAGFAPTPSRGSSSAAVAGLGLAVVFLPEALRDDRPVAASGASTVAVAAARRPVAAAAREARAGAPVPARRSCPSGSSRIRACFGRDELDDTNDLSTKRADGRCGRTHSSRTTF